MYIGVYLTFSYNWEFLCNFENDEEWEVGA